MVLGCQQLEVNHISTLKYIINGHATCLWLVKLVTLVPALLNSICFGEMFLLT